jgi:NAD(P)-dependent dehydrogenase (short-subunit alcohol dehydrogenase family)
LAGPVVIVTGASRGIGRATAEHLSGRGWRVFAVARGVEEQPPRPNLSFLRADVRDSQSVARAVAVVLAETGNRLDAVVANAGIAAVGMFQDTPAAVMAGLLETNYFGALNVVRETLPALQAGHGRIVVISSDAGLYGSPGLSGYSASKFALEGWAESLAYELRPFGVRVSIVQPGAFRTGIWQSEVYLPEDGPRRHLAESLAGNWAAAAANAADPRKVALAVEKALTARHPRLRYSVGGDARHAAVLRRLLPERLFVRWVERRNGIRRNVEEIANGR